MFGLIIIAAYQGIRGNSPPPYSETGIFWRKALLFRGMVLLQNTLDPSHYQVWLAMKADLVSNLLGAGVPAIWHAIQMSASCWIYLIVAHLAGVACYVDILFPAILICRLSFVIVPGS